MEKANPKEGRWLTQDCKLSKEQYKNLGEERGIFPLVTWDKTQPQRGEGPLWDGKCWLNLRCTMEGGRALDQGWEDQGPPL